MADENEVKTGSASVAPIGAAKPKRTIPNKILPNDRLAPGKWQAALRAYAVVYESNGNKPVTNEEAGKIIGMAGTTVVMTNAFFCDLGLLTRQKEEAAFIPSAEVLAYNKAHEWDPETAGEKLRPVFERMWFSEVLVPRLKFRPYDIEDALAVLAEACDANPDYRDRLVVLIELMACAGVIIRDGDVIKAAAGSKVAEKPAESVSVAPVVQAPTAPAVDEGHAEFTFILDPKRGRKVVVHAPHDMSQKEFQRVRKWMEIQLVAEGGEDTAK